MREEEEEKRIFEKFEADHEAQMEKIRDVVAHRSACLFVCKHCKGGVDYILVQTRSMDEGSTTKFTCKTCRTTWCA